jgi:hypothetical protein
MTFHLFRGVDRASRYPEGLHGLRHHPVPRPLWPLWIILSFALVAVVVQLLVLLLS